MRKKRHVGGAPFGTHRRYPHLDEVLIMEGIAQVDISELCGVSARVVCAWFAQGTRCPVDKAIIIAKFLGMPVEWLFREDA